MSDKFHGRLLAGEEAALRRSLDIWRGQAVDYERTAAPERPYASRETTLRAPVTLRAPGTFSGREIRTITLEPYQDEGWWMERADLDDCLPTRVSARNVWTTGQIVSNIVLRSGPPQNYVRMVEHLVALRLGLGLDRARVRLDSGDPPLFARGSLDLVEACENVGLVETGAPARYVTVKERVSIVAPNGAFLILAPPADGHPRLRLDCAIRFANAIGNQRLRTILQPDEFRSGAYARTNTSAAKKIYCRTLGRVFADIRHLGYTDENILIAGRRRYYNEPRLMHQGRSLEAVWHRAMLDLLAALALIEEGRFVGEVISFKAGHALDVKLVTQCYRRDLWTPFVPS